MFNFRYIFSLLPSTRWRCCWRCSGRRRRCSKLLFRKICCFSLFVIVVGFQWCVRLLLLLFQLLPVSMRVCVYESVCVCWWCNDAALGSCCLLSSTAVCLSARFCSDSPSSTSSPFFCCRSGCFRISVCLCCCPCRDWAHTLRLRLTLRSTSSPSISCTSATRLAVLMRSNNALRLLQALCRWCCCAVCSFPNTQTLKHSVSHSYIHLPVWTSSPTRRQV